MKNVVAVDVALAGLCRRQSVHSELFPIQTGLQRPVRSLCRSKENLPSPQTEIQEFGEGIKDQSNRDFMALQRRQRASCFLQGTAKALSSLEQFCSVVYDTKFGRSKQKRRI